MYYIQKYDNELSDFIHAVVSDDNNYTPKFRNIIILNAYRSKNTSTDISVIKNVSIPKWLWDVWSIRRNNKIQHITGKNLFWRRPSLLSTEYRYILTSPYFYQKITKNNLNISVGKARWLSSYCAELPPTMHDIIFIDFDKES